MILKRIKSAVLSAVMTIMMPLCLISVSAEEANEAVRSAQDGVYAIQLVYHDTSTGDSFPFVGGTGFFINEDMLLTCDHVISMDSSVQNSISALAKEKYGSYSKNNITIEVVLQSDISVEAEAEFSSAEGDWAVLKLKEKIKNKTLEFGNSDDCKNTQSVYAIGYPSSVASYDSVENYSHSDISTTNGKISKVTSTGGVKQIQHGATLSAGVSGGPLVDDNGAVIGINASKVKDQDYYYSIATEQILDILDQKNIPYTRYGGAEANMSEEEINSRFENALNSAKQIDLSEYTEESAEKLRMAIEEASRLTIGQSSSDELSAAADKLENARIALIRDDSISVKTVIFIAAGVCFVLFAAVIVVLVFKGKKSKSSDDIFISRAEPVSQPAVSVLYTLMRTSNGERAVIDKVSFVVGKDRSCDYCIENNSSISRSHARFELQGNECFITDLRSTNGTYLNGKKLSPNSKSKLKSGDVIKISDEEFVFSE